MQGAIPDGAANDALGPITAAAVTDLAARLGVPRGRITVVRAELVTWPDAGLGCRRPGLRYRQVPVDGCRILLEHAGRRYAYHCGGRTAVPFLCEHPG